MDERFKAYLGLHVAKEGGEAERLYKERGLPTIRHNKKLRRDIINSIQRFSVPHVTNESTDGYIPILWDSEAHDSTIERMVRGLFYHHFGKVVAKNAKVQVYWFGENQPLYDGYLSEVVIGDKSFVYRYAKAEDDEFASMWLFNFYESHFAGGMILP